LAYSPRNPSFDPVQLTPHIPQLLLKPEVQHMGQQVALAQRTIARLIREVLISQEEEREARKKLRELGKRESRQSQPDYSDPGTTLPLMSYLSAIAPTP